jgi:hypothetical protein
MKQLRYWSFLPAFCLLALPLFGQGLAIKDGVAKVGEVANVPVTLQNDAETQGVVIAVDWDGAIARGDGVTPGDVLADADTVVPRVEDTYAVLGVVMDSDGMGDEVIPPGENEIATIDVEILQADTLLTIAFADGLYATVDGGPLLDNIVVVGGLSIGAGEGLELVPGEIATVSCLPRLYVGSAANNNNPVGTASIMLENCVDVEGYVTAVCHDRSVLRLQDIQVGSAATAVGAEFSAADITDDGGTLGVILDVEAPFDGQVISPGTNQVARYVYAVIPEDMTGDTDLVFCDDVLGDPAKENVFVSGGQSFGKDEGLALEDGVFKVTPKGTPPPEAVVTFACGGLGLDAAGFPNPVVGSIGGIVEICYYLLNPEDNVVGSFGQGDQIQGFSMALTFDCALTLESNTLDISGTILEAIGAEFISVDASSEPGEFDACELIIGVLVDALPPFNGATIPPGMGFQRMGCLDFSISSDGDLCGQSLDMEFQDGVKATGGVPIKNLVSVDNQSIPPAATIDCAGEDGITIVNEAVFYRGDCNFSNEEMGSMAVDIADAATVISYLFAHPIFKPEIECEDACDANDDGRLDLADAMSILSYLFKHGPQLPAPGPGWDIPTQMSTPRGPDPTIDPLDCKGGTICP